MGEVYSAQHHRLSRRETPDRYLVGMPVGQVAGVLAAIPGALDWARGRRDLIPNSCVRLGRAGPAGAFMRGVHHYPKPAR